MWKVVYIAQTKENAQEIKELLTNNGFLIQMNVAGAKKGGQGGAYEISVPYSEAEDAYEVLCDNRFSRVSRRNIMKKPKLSALWARARTMLLYWQK